VSPDSIVRSRILACRASDPGSNPGRGAILLALILPAVFGNQRKLPGIDLAALLKAFIASSLRPTRNIFFKLVLPIDRN
jgi:hypothetical protein